MLAFYLFIISKSVSKAKCVYMLQNSNDSLVKKVYENHVAPYESTLPTTMLQGLERVCASDKYATMSTETVVLRDWIQLPCAVYRVPKDSIAGAVSMAIRKRSPFLGILKHTYVKCHIIQIYNLQLSNWLNS
jgi:hypothetical protein